MKTIITLDTTDRLSALNVTCQCPGGTRVPPIRLAQGTLKVLSGSMSPEALIMTYRCGSCQSVVLVRARHLRNGGP